MTRYSRTIVNFYKWFFLLRSCSYMHFSDSCSCNCQKEVFTPGVTSVLLSGLDNYGYSLLALILGCKYSLHFTVLSVLETVPLLRSKHSHQKHHNDLGKAYFTKIRSPMVLLELIKSHQQADRLLLCKTGLLGLWRERVPHTNYESQCLVTKLWSLIERKNVSLSWKAYNYEWMNDPDPYRFFP